MFLRRWFYAWRVRLRALLDRNGADRELDDELRHHVDLEVESRCARGVAAPEARRQALAALGGMASTREHVRASRFGASLAEGLRDVRYGLRLLRRNPRFTAAAVFTLAFAIGATTTVYSVVDAVLLQPPPFPNPERLVTLWQTDPENGNRPAAVAPANFLDWREQAGSFEQVAAVEPWSFDFIGPTQPEEFYASAVTEGFFETLGVQAAHGRTFLPDEYRSGSGAVVMTDGLWQRRFGGDAEIVGQSLVLNGEPHIVVGVLAPNFELGLEEGLTVRDLFAPKAIAEWENNRRGTGWWHVVGRIRLDVTLGEAQAEMDAIAGRLAVDNPRTNTDVGARVIPLRTWQVDAVQTILLLLWAAVLFVLLIASVNVANLMLARSALREQEFAIRSAVGGGRGRLVRQLLAESVVIAALGGIGGVALTVYSLDAIVGLLPSDVPRLAQIAINGRVLVFATGLVLATALVFGLAPARQASRQAAGPLRAHRVGATVEQQRVRRLLVMAEVALALVLLVAAGLVLQSFARLVNVDLGYVPDDAVALQIFMDRDSENSARVNFIRETLQQIHILPDVEAAGAVSAFPLAAADLTAETPLTIHDLPPPPPGEELSVAVTLATPGYLEAIRLPLRSGRWFEESDDGAGTPVAVINETLARQHWPEADPLAHRITVQVSGREFEAEIVGVVGATRPRGFQSAPRPEVYVAHAQGGHEGLTYDGGMTYVVRTAADPAASIRAIQDVIWTANPVQTIYSVSTVSQLLSDTLAARRFTTTLLALFGLAALVLAGVGIYGVVAVATAQRTREIGLRLAMGAQPRDVLRMVVGGAVGLAGAGVGAGLIAALVASRGLGSLLFNVAPSDPATLAGVSLLLLLVAAGAAYVPARRAAGVDPLTALRVE
ncbi:MAG: ABC transporter permease [Acidobacteria bacterium]|nr:ABC transporter permease [Acidobacteriota bacterium]MYJ06066.1 ABC transporter permease [Acidobacteriota bacterium]